MPKSQINNKNPQQKYRLYGHFIQMLVQISLIAVGNVDVSTNSTARFTKLEC